MMKKLKEFGKKPITWGAYGKLAIVAYVITLVMWLIYMVYEGWIKIPTFEEKVERFKNKFKGNGCFEDPVDDDF
jgi:hypothetical protein